MRITQDGHGWEVRVADDGPGAVGVGPRGFGLRGFGLTDLTERETAVLLSMSKGLSNAELYLAETTVKTHVARILAKLGVRDRTQAVVLVHRAGLAPP